MGPCLRHAWIRNLAGKIELYTPGIKPGAFGDKKIFHMCNCLIGSEVFCMTYNLRVCNKDDR